MGLRRLFLNKTDRELEIEISSDDWLTIEAERGYRRRGGIDTELAEELSRSRERATVARAVGRQRLLGGGPDSHRGLERVYFGPNPKVEDRERGQDLREKRGVERD
jgi:hypothetical protein